MDQFVSTYGLYAAYALLGIALLAAILMPLIQSFSNPRALLGALVGVVAIAVLFFIGYSVAGNEVVPIYIKNNVTSAVTSKMIGGALITMYILILLALVSIVVTEITKIFN
ncbi:MAG: hypothetical protein WA958_09940 [Tunicatimonas sp.]